MSSPDSCQRMETGACKGCNVVALLWKKAEMKSDVDSVSDSISAEYCPEGSGGIDQTVRGTVYNYRPEATSHE